MGKNTLIKVEDRQKKLDHRRSLIDSQKKEFFFLQSIIKTLPGSVYWKDKEGIYLGCNDFMLEMAGTSEVVGKTDFDLPWKEQAPQIRKNDLEVIRLDSAIELEESPTLANGQQIVMLTRKAPLKDEQGNTVGILGVSLDITERKNLEAALKQIKEQTEAANVILLQAKEQAEFTLDNIVTNMPGHVYWKDRHGVYLGCNNRQAQSLGLRYGSEVIGKTDFDLPWAKDVANVFRENDIRIMELGKTETIEENAQIDGKEAIMLSQKTPLRDKDGNVVGVLGISIDITERKKFEAALKDAKEKAEAANKAKTEFLENMRHDIRTPLIGITGFASIIADEVKDPKIKEYVDNLSASSYALLDLLNEILEVIKVSSGEIPVLKKKFDLRKKLTDVINLNQARAQHKRIDLIFDYDSNIPPYLIGDSTRVHRIALELVANALNFTNKGAVKLLTQLAKTEERDLVIKIIVEDTGIGIEPEKQQEIFLQFKRLTPSYEGIYKGAGLGLAIVKQFIDEMQGEIYVESQVGVGTKFTCVIPFKRSLLDEELGSEDIIALQLSDKKYSTVTEYSLTGNVSTEAESVSKSRVLLVEDQQIAAMVVMNMLSQLDCTVDLAQDGNAAVQLAQDNEYDLIFMDIGLPEIDGYEVTRRIRLSELNKGTHIPIIALTAHVDEENKQRCLEVGMNAVLTKPLVKPKAEDILNNFIAYRKKSHDLRLKEKIIEETDPLHIDGEIIDFELAKQQLGGKEELVHEMLIMLTDSFPKELETLRTAHGAEDWQAIKAVAHKLKGGSCYTGTVRLKEACARLEDAVRAEKKELYQDLYKQMLSEIAAVDSAIKNRLI